MRASAPLVSFFAGLAAATPAANYAGFNILFQDNFNGASGTPPDSSKWNIMQNIHVNNEVETYTTSSRNIQISGGSTIQFVPWKSSSGQWTSSRIESNYKVLPAPGKVTIVEAEIALGWNPSSARQGIWPAFWMLGDSIHHGTGWPQCGELDIFEQVSGAMTGYGTAHCPNCGETTGKTASIWIPDLSTHTWTIKIDRSDANNERIYWLRDGNVYHTLAPADVGDSWATLAHSPFFIILNLAVGGDWPGNPNGATADGYGSMMEVSYVAVYSN